jgi:hypothetical protein
LFPTSTDRLHFNSDLTYQRTASGFAVSTDANTKTFDGHFLSDIGDRIAAGGMTFDEVVRDSWNAVPAADLYIPAALSVLYDQGIVNLEPG